MIWAKDSYSNSVPGVGSPNPPTFVPSKSLVVSCEWKWVLFCAVLRSHSRIGTLERAGSAKATRNHHPGPRLRRTTKRGTRICRWLPGIDTYISCMCIFICHVWAVYQFNLIIQFHTTRKCVLFVWNVKRYRWFISHLYFALAVILTSTSFCYYYA